MASLKQTILIRFVRLIFSMSLHKKLWFITKSGSGPLYDEPDFNASCMTETVYGESSRIIKKSGVWYYIECNDNYKGWIHSFFGLVSNKRNLTTYIVAYPDVNGRFSFKFPFGSESKLKLEGSIPINEPLGINNIINVANNLIGSPYRWGGKTSLGFDCSGLVQSVLKVCGIYIPRDSHEQRQFFENSKIDLVDAKPGDLHFFGKEHKINHVGFSTGGLGILHAQGMVKIESMDSNSSNYNKDLLDIYISTHSIKPKFQ